MKETAQCRRQVWLGQILPLLQISMFWFCFCWGPNPIPQATYTVLYPRDRTKVDIQGARDLLFIENPLIWCQYPPATKVDRHAWLLDSEDRERRDCSDPSTPGGRGCWWESENSSSQINASKMGKSMTVIHSFNKHLPMESPQASSTSEHGKRATQSGCFHTDIRHHLGTWRGSHDLGAVLSWVLGCVRKQDEQAIENKPVHQ